MNQSRLGVGQCQNPFIDQGIVDDDVGGFKAMQGKQGQEAGIARFDVIQQEDDPTRFVLIEAYKNAEAPALHRETEHYKIWRDRVESMMAEPRVRVKYSNVFPADENW